MYTVKDSTLCLMNINFIAVIWLIFSLIFGVQKIKDTIKFPHILNEYLTFLANKVAWAWYHLGITIPFFYNQRYYKEIYLSTCPNFCFTLSSSYCVSIKENNNSVMRFCALQELFEAVPVCALCINYDKIWAMKQMCTLHRFSKCFICPYLQIQSMLKWKIKWLNDICSYLLGYALGSHMSLAPISKIKICGQNQWIAPMSYWKSFLTVWPPYTMDW